LDSFASTLEALVISLLLAAPWPLLLGTIGLLLGRAQETTAFASAVSSGFLWVSAPLFFLQAFRVLCDRGGVAASHFGWRETTRRSLRRELGRVMALLLPAGFVFTVLFHHEHVGLAGGLERLALLLATISLAIFCYALLEPQHGIALPVLSRDQTSLLYRLRRLWPILALVVLAVLLVLAISGYVYAAGIYLRCLSRSVLLALALVFVQQLVVRWLTVSRRRLAYQAAVARREAALAAELEKEDTKASRDDVPPAAEEPEIDVATLSEEVQRLLNSALIVGLAIGLWYTWKEILPGFDILRNITLWQQTVTVAGEVQHAPVTLADAGVAILIAVVTVAVVRHFPALLQIVLYQRIGMRSADVYTAVTVSRYLIVATGSVLVFSTIGFRWSQIQWLVAALGVGVGFGLQEIVANFISGLIILFERPIRIGDVVTVGDVDGTVTRIRIRATTIHTWDRKELLVPNKEFVTGRLLNWSLSDQVTRVIVPVGIAYGSDVQQAMSLMMAAAEEDERVLADPAPYVIFASFGDNALSLELRCFLESVEHRLSTVSKLHEAINSKFNEAGIVIAFPQRDVHLDTSRPLDVRIRKHEGTEGSPG
jgi:potassium efflux system protein